MNTSRLVAAGFWFLCCVSSAQVSSTVPERWTQSTQLMLGFGSARVALPHNRPEQIRHELLDTNTIYLLAKSGGLSDSELATVRIVPGARSNWFDLYQIGRSEKAFTVLSELLRSYLSAREEGHTKGFLFSAITNKVPPLSIPDADLRVLVLNQPLIPVSWVKKAESGTRTNEAGRVAGIETTATIINGRLQTRAITNIPKTDEIYRWSSYRVTDGEIEWIYRLTFRPNGRLDFIDAERQDAKESDPSFKKAIKEVENEVEAEMKKKGTFRRLGSVNEFWRLKKEKLAAKGIEWRSPAELNPNANYD